MVTAIRHGFHNDVATIFANDIQFKKSNYYYFLGKIDSWSGTELFDSINSDETEKSDLNVRTNSLFYKKILPSDVSLVISRYDWTSGESYTKWDHTVNIAGKKFYCVTGENVVYKCLDNAGGLPSIVNPTGKSFTPFRTTDGYLWKYMYTIPSFKQNRFNSIDYIPVQRSLTDSFYNKGSVDDVVVAASGNGYIDTPLTKITVAGATTGSGASANINVDSSGIITSVTINNGGSAYNSGVSIDILSASGYGAKLTATITGGVITNLVIVSGGIGYTQSSAITFYVGGAILIPSVSRITGSIEKITIKNAGSGYSSTPNLTVYGTGGIGKYGNSTAILTANVYKGSIVSINIVDSGINYPTDNDTTIVIQGNGKGALFSPVIYDGKIIDVIVENPGTGYTAITATVVGSGIGAIVNPIVSISDFESDQSIVEQTTISGAIHAIEVTNSGNDYSSLAKISVIGDGEGCSARPIIIDGKISYIVVDVCGKNYSYANIVISDTARNFQGTSIDAVCYAILPPSGGHGHDATTELFSSTIIINSALKNDYFLGNILQDYRQFGIVKNPKDLTTGIALRADSYLMAFKIRVNNITYLYKDQVLTFNDIKFRVVDTEGSNIVYLQQLGSKITNLVGEFLGIDINGVKRSYKITNIIAFPVANKYSGNLLYVSNESPFSFTENQGITIKTFLTF